MALRERKAVSAEYWIVRRCNRPLEENESGWRERTLGKALRVGKGPWMRRHGVEGESYTRTCAVPQETEAWCVHHRAPQEQQCPMEHHWASLDKGQPPAESRESTQPTFKRPCCGAWAPRFGSHCLAHALGTKVPSKAMYTLWAGPSHLLDKKMSMRKYI